MFVHHCTSCAKRQLIFPSQVTAVAGADRGVRMTFTCWCGAEQTAVTELVPTRLTSEAVAA